MISEYFQTLAPQTLVLVAADIHWALSEYATGYMATDMFSQDEYRGTLCPFSKINSIREATAVINHISVGCFNIASPLPPPPHTMWCNPARIGDSQSPSALLSFDSLFYIFPQAIPTLSALLHSNRHSLIPSVLIRTPPLYSALCALISVLPSRRLGPLDSHWSTSV